MAAKKKKGPSLSVGRGEKLPYMQVVALIEKIKTQAQSQVRNEAL